MVFLKLGWSSAERVGREISFLGVDCQDKSERHRIFSRRRRILSRHMSPWVKKIHLDRDQSDLEPGGGGICGQM